VFLSDTALPFLDSRYLNGLVTTFYTYLHPTPSWSRRTSSGASFSASNLAMTRRWVFMSASSAAMSDAAG
jgi:hypothetical protein